MQRAIDSYQALTSKSGACEFAKRFLVDRMTVDVSPLSIRKIVSAKTPIGWCNYITTVHRTLRLSTKQRIAGFGFKAASRRHSSSTHGKRVRRLLMMIHRSQLPCELWLSVALGVAVSPEIIGRVISRLQEHFIPREPDLPPQEVFPYPGMRDFQEYSCFHGWMKQYLHYLKWYCSVALAPDVRLDSFVDAPVYIRTWAAPKVDLDHFRFGVMFRIYDWTVEMLSSDKIRCLSSGVPSERIDHP